MLRPMRQTSLSALAWLLIGLLALIWGASFLSNRVALVEAGVLTTVAIRVAGGAALLWLWVAVRRLPVPPLRRLLPVSLAMGLINNALPFTLIVWGQVHIESGLAAILNAATAIFGVLVAAAVFADERLTRRRLAGVVLGFLGVVVAIGPHHLAAFDLRAAGQIAVLGAGLSYALAAAYARRAFHGILPEVAAAGMLTGAAMLTLPAALLVEGVPAGGYSPGAWTALCYLAVAASALAYLLYYRVLALAGAGNLLLVTLLVAPVAMALGAVVLDETLPLRAYLGFTILALGLLMLDGRVLPARRNAESA